MLWTDAAENKITDAVFRGQALGAPANWYYGLLTSTKGPRANSTAYALTDTMSVLANDAKLHLYACTTAGTTAAAQGTLYPGAIAEVIADGTAVFTEQSTALDAGTAIVEPTGGTYARVVVTAALASFAGTQGAGTTTASSGSLGITSNNATVTFPAPVGAAFGYIWGVGMWTAATAGTCWAILPMSTPKTVNDGDPAPSIAAGAGTIRIDT